MTERATRVGLVAFGVVLGLSGLYAFVTAVPPSEWVRVVVWLAGGVLVHDVVLAPLAVVVGFLAIRRAPARARRGGRFAILVLAAVVMVAIPLLATGGLRT